MRDDAFQKYPSKDFLNKSAHTWEETANPHMVELPYPGVNLMRHLNTHSAVEKGLKMTGETREVCSDKIELIVIRQGIYVDCILVRLKNLPSKIFQD